MTTRARAGVIKSIICLNLHTLSTPPISPIPKSIFAAMSDPNWLQAMEDEF